MKNSEYIQLNKILDNYRSTSLDIASKATLNINNNLFDELLELYEQIEISKESLINLQELL